MLDDQRLGRVLFTEYLAAGEVEITATDALVRADLLPAQAPADRSVAQSVARHLPLATRLLDIFMRAVFAWQRKARAGSGPIRGPAASPRSSAPGVHSTSTSTSTA